MRDSQVISNSAPGSSGGGIYLGGSNQLYGVSFSNNTSQDIAGGVPVCNSNCLAGQYGNIIGYATTSISGQDDDPAASVCPMFDGCLSCEAGTFMTNDYSTSVDDCTPCGAGLISPPNATGCSACPAGTFATNQANDTDGGQVTQVPAGATMCNRCPAGTRAASASTFVCQLCDSGKTSVAGSQDCSNCPAGEKSASGDKSCSKCHNGTYNAKPGTPYCSLCQDNYGPEYWSHAGATACDSCIPGFYYYDDGTPEKYCHECPEHSDCGNYNQVLRTLPVNPKYYRFAPTTEVLYKCPYGADACSGERFHL